VSDHLPRGLPAALNGLSRPIVMGVLNITPDSFSDGGQFLSPDDALRHGIAMMELGADLIDVGGESTRPGAKRISTDEEQSRVIGVITALRREDVPVSIDTMHAVTARKAVEAGACLVNDVSGGRADLDMYATIAELQVPYVLMHWREFDVRSQTVYGDVIADVRQEFLMACERAREQGVDPAYIIMDPGIGFAKEADANWQILANLADVSAGYPVLIGASRKRFLGALLGSDEPRPVAERDVATHVISALVGEVWGIRVHEVRGTRDAIAVAQAMRGVARG
jgi:dihydropteroate synthase